MAFAKTEDEDLKVAPYNPDFNVKYKAHINFERTQRGSAMLSLMKHDFKMAKEQEVVASIREEHR